MNAISEAVIILFRDNMPLLSWSKQIRKSEDKHIRVIIRNRGKCYTPIIVVFLVGGFLSVVKCIFAAK